MRRQHRYQEQTLLDLNLNPMMDLFAVLIPALLMMSVVVEVSILEATHAQENESTTKVKQKPTQDLDLNLYIKENGYLLSFALGALGYDRHLKLEKKNRQSLWIPIKYESVSCKNYLYTQPPPRNRNRLAERCRAAYQQMKFWIYDDERLYEAILKIKKSYPKEEKIIIIADRTIEYETVVSAMDTVREEHAKHPNKKILFDQFLVMMNPS
jgi:biopolymer transport protein ExbD